MSIEVERARRRTTGQLGGRGVWAALGQWMDRRLKMLLRITPVVKTTQWFPVTVHGQKLGGDYIRIPGGTY